jgi:hypothetical protein
MRTRILALAALLVTASLAQAADLAKIERKIARQPACKAPKYCLLVFGPDAQFRVWLVQDGETLYVDLNGNGDLTEAGEKVAIKQKEKTYRSFEAGDLHDGKLRHTGLLVGQMLATPEWVGDQEFARLKQKGSEPWVWTLGLSAERPADDARKLPRHIKYIINGDGLGMLVFADRPEDAPIVHLNGPWTLGLQDTKGRFVVGEKSQLQIGVGTQGIGAGTFSFVMYANTIPDDVYPLADITFPAKAGGKPITSHAVLKSRC